MENSVTIEYDIPAINELKSSFEQQMNSLKDTFEVQMNSLKDSYKQQIGSIRDSFVQGYDRLEVIVLELAHRVQKIKCDSDVVNTTITESIEDVKKEITQLKRQASIQTEVSEVISSSCLNEFEERETRRKNALIFGIPEANVDMAHESKNHDKAFLNTIIKTVSPSLVDQPFHCYRIGKFVSHASGSTNPRPVKIIMASTDSAQLLRNNFVERKMASDVPGPLQSLSISKDRTKSQQAKYKQLRAKLVERSRNGEKDLYIGQRGGREVILSRVKGVQREVEGRTNYVEEQREPPDKGPTSINTPFKTILTHCVAIFRK